MNRIENYVKNLEKWHAICNGIIKSSDNVVIKIRAQELKEELERDLLYYNKELVEL